MLFIGDDWAEDHHDVEVQDEHGRVLRRARLREGIEGITAFGELVGRFLPEDGEAADVLVCIEVDRGPWVNALIAAGYRVFGVDPRQAHRHREILSSSGAKSDKGDAHALADMVRVRRHQLLEAGRDSEISEAVKVVTRAHQSMIWDRTRHMLRLRSALREYFPAILILCSELDLALTSRPILALLAKAPDPGSAAKLTPRQILPMFKGCRNKDAKAARVQQILRGEHLGQPAVVTAAYAASVRSSVAVLGVVIEQITVLEEEVKAHFGRHPAAEIICSQPGLGPILGARVLAEFGDAPGRYRSAKARKNYAGTSPITKQSGKTRVVAARYVHNDRLIDALQLQASCALLHDTDAKTYYDQLRARGLKHNPALRQLANRLVGILHGCLIHGAQYDSAVAWAHRHPVAA
ncbi:IS110 family transposase [Tsukamurella sp. PLM1]|uniref:IS110 family transposase n=1 Tax=Tsukamurella sp. PLM1 TaxID=2929795 RepID=UPI00205D8039|nr:IS110 family transposase [Tsukamurella sp. PLM1]BDH55737.1 IS110 family transposase [Tsukamurella sp. PLM1]BDH58754.1 IS110 family transposase [Tsukamurella sp. PLM1]